MDIGIGLVVSSMNLNNRAISFFMQLTSCDVQLSLFFLTTFTSYAMAIYETHTH